MAGGGARRAATRIAAAVLPSRFTPNFSFSSLLDMALPRANASGRRPRPRRLPPSPARAEAPTPPPSRLGAAIRAKQLHLQRTLEALGPDALDQRLQDALDVPSQYALAVAMDCALSTRGAPVLIVEAEAARDPRTVAASVSALVDAGVDAVVVTAPAVAAASAGGGGGGGFDADAATADEAATNACLLAAVSAARATPVLLRDWIVHPLQLADAKAAGAAGALGAAAAVLGRGATTLTSFGAAMGLDIPLEVVNAAEATAHEGAPLVAVNVSLALALGGVPGAAASIARGVLSGLAPGTAALVGVDSLEDAALAAAAGAAGVVVKAGALASAASDNGDSVAAAVAEFRRAVELGD